MDRMIESAAQWFIIGAILGGGYFGIKIIRARIINWLMRNNPQYNEKHQEKYLHMDDNSISLHWGRPPGVNENLIMDAESIILKPDPKHQEDKNVEFFSFSQIAKIEITNTKNWAHGSFYHLCIWRNDTSQIEVPLEHQLPDYAFPFRPIVLDAAREIERRVNEHLVNQQKKA